MAIGAVFILGCSLGARSPEMYRDDMNRVLDSKSGDLKSCYDGILKSDPKASGKVTVKFTVQKDSGRLVGAELSRAATTAPAAVSQCVLSSLNSVVLKPADKRQGEATWSWEFSAAPAAN